MPGQHGEEVTQNNAFFYLWVAAAFISTCYTTVWDFKMDWGLLDSNAGENTLLREEIVYGYKVRRARENGYGVHMSVDGCFKSSSTSTVGWVPD